MQLHPADRVAAYTAGGWWSEETWDSLLRARARERPGALAVADPPNHDALQGGAPRRLSWADLERDVAATAAVLAGRGIGEDDVVGVQLPNGTELVVTLLALSRLGAIATPFPVAFREHELSSLLRVAGAVAHVTWPDAAGRVAGAADRVLSWRDGALEETVPPVAHRPVPSVSPLGPNDCVTVCWTSGTERAPKGVPRCANDWLAIARMTAAAAGITRDDVLLNPFPMVNMAGIGGMFLPWLLTGCTLIQHHPFDLAVFLGQIADERITYTVAPPPLLNLMLRDPSLTAGGRLDSLRAIGSGSAPLDPAMTAGFPRAFGIEVLNFFGSNEGIALVSTPHTVPDPAHRASFFPRPSAADGMEVRLVDGELRIKGPTVFAGYLNADELDDPFDDDGFFRSGDVFAEAGHDAGLLRYVDRRKDIVVRGGMNVSAAEVEGLLVSHPKVAQVAVVAAPDDVLGERVCAVVVPADAADPPVLEELGAHLRGMDVASFKHPERLRIVDDLPRNPVGKVLKRELRRALANPTAEVAS